MNEQEYRALDGHIYSTLLKTIYKNSDRHILKIEPTEAMIFGTLAHMYILEPERWIEKGYKAMPEFYPTSDETKQKYLDATGSVGKNYTRTKECQIQKAKWIAHNDGNIITKEDMDALHTMKSNMVENGDLFQEYLQDGQAEHAMLVEEFTVQVDDVLITCPVKILVDYIKVVGDDVYITDVKTCQSASEHDFKRQIWNFGYDIQAAFYVDVAKVVYPEKNIHFIWAATEKVAPYWFGYYKMSNAVYSEGRKKYLSVFEKATDYFSGKNKLGYTASSNLVLI